MRIYKPHVTKAITDNNFWITITKINDGIEDSNNYRLGTNDNKWYGKLYDNPNMTVFGTKEELTNVLRELANEHNLEFHEGVSTW